MTRASNRTTGLAVAAVVAVALPGLLLAGNGSAGGGPSTSAPSAPSPSITLTADGASDPDGTITGQPGATLTVTVRATATDVAGYQAAVAFDPAVVRVRNVSGTGDFADPVVDVDDEDGRVAFNQVRSAGVDDPELAEISLELVGSEGEATRLAFVEAETLLATSDAEHVVPESHDGATVTVASSTRSSGPSVTLSSASGSEPSAASEASAPGGRSGFGVAVAAVAAVSVLALSRRLR